MAEMKRVLLIFFRPCNLSWPQLTGRLEINPAPHTDAANQISGSPSHSYAEHTPAFLISAAFVWLCHGSFRLVGEEITFGG